MNIKYIKSNMADIPIIKKDGLYILDGALRAYILLNPGYYMYIHLTSGFKCDGLSIPLPFRWFLKKWDDNKPLYNLAGVIHDALYITKGYGIFSREECDDIFRGLLRDAGISRFKAGVADKCVELFGGSHRHWGGDAYQQKNRIYIIQEWDEKNSS